MEVENASIIIPTNWVKYANINEFFLPNLSAMTPVGISKIKIDPMKTDSTIATSVKVSPLAVRKIIHTPAKARIG